MSTWSRHKAPNWAPDAIATEKGWVDSKTGELLVATKSLVLDGKKPEPKKEEPKVEEPVVEEVTEDMIDFSNMTKKQLIDYAMENGIDIDVKATKNKLIEIIENS